ncbi:MAG: SDR family oxidoreductase [Anaeromyxobacteraceae bacterium]|nr:SDR family oxidoreductase [Anaeromyxobacteraceae bacterium]
MPSRPRRAAAPPRRVALVTGAGSPDGIGFAAAALLARRGLAVVVTSTTARIHRRVAALAALGAEAAGAVADLADPREARAVVDLALERFGRLDVLVNAAGMGRVGAPELVQPFQAFTPEAWRASLATNLLTAVNVTRAALPALRRSGAGRIVNVTSTTGPVVACPGESPYAAAKAALTGLTRTLALELARAGITVNAVAPGWIATAASTPAERRAARATPPRRAGRPAEVAEAIAFLASEGASYVNGATLVVDGGNALQERKG